MKIIVCHLERIHNIHQRSASSFHLAEEDFKLGNLKFVPKGEIDEVFGITIIDELISNNIRNTPYYNAYLEMVAKHDLKMSAKKERKKKTVNAKQPKSKPAVKKASKLAPAPKSKASKGINWTLCTTINSPSPADAEIGARSYKTSSGGDTEVLQITEELGEDAGKQDNIKERTVELDQGQDRPDPGRTLEPRPPPEQEVMDEDQARLDPRESRGALTGPDPEPTHDEFMADLYPKVQESLKFLADQISSIGTLSSMKNLEDAFAIGDQFINHKSTKDYVKRIQLKRDKSEQNRIKTGQKWEAKTNVEAEVVSMDTVPIYQASSSVPPLSTPIPVTDLSPPKPASSTTQAPVFTATTVTTITPLPPPSQQQSSIELELVERTNKNLDNTTQNLGSRVYIFDLRDLPHKIDEPVREKVKESLAWKKSDTRDALPSSPKQQSDPHAEQPVEDIPIPDSANISDPEDTDSAYLPKTKLIGPIQKVIKSGLMSANLCLSVVYQALSISKMKAACYLDFGLELLILEHMWINGVCTYDIITSYGISHWWFNRQKLYIDHHIVDSSRKDYLKEITLRRADYQEYTIAEKDFKSLYSSDFEDLNLLLLQDFQLGIKSYQNQLNITKQRWDAKGFEFKYEYTINESPRVVAFTVGNNKRNIMWFNEIYKFSDGTLTNIMEALDYRVKEYKRLKTRWIFQNLKCFVGGRVRDNDYRLLQRMK
nr:hypothetical protein [Tanacetum cinerariifolium]